jgi:hypothetical protein
LAAVAKSRGKCAQVSGLNRVGLGKPRRFQPFAYILFGQIIRIIIMERHPTRCRSEEKVKSFAGLVVYLFGIKSSSRAGTTKLAAL